MSAVGGSVRSHARRTFEDAERIAVLVTAFPAAVLVEDERRRVLLANERFCDLFGLADRPEALVGADSAALVRDMKNAAADPARFARRVREVMAAGELVPDEEIEFRGGQVYDRDHVPIRSGRRDMGRLWMYWNVTQRRELERQRERTLAAELTARKATEAARRQLAVQNNALRDLDRLKTEYITVLSHELRTPLTSIMSFAALLRETEPPLAAEALEFVDIIERNSDRLLHLVADLLLIVRLETGALPLELTAVDVRELVEEAVRSRSPAAGRRGVALETQGTAQGPPLSADRQRLAQVLDNLLSNAVKFTGPGGRVSVAARYDGAEWRIDVTDAGMGIPPEEQGRLFERFFRASNARIAQVPGAGLGLSVARAIMA